MENRLLLENHLYFAGFFFVIVKSATLILKEVSWQKYIKSYSLKSWQLIFNSIHLSTCLIKF